MTDTGQIPDEGQPENAGGQPEVQQPDSPAVGLYPHAGPADAAAGAPVPPAPEHELQSPGAWEEGQPVSAPDVYAQQQAYASQDAYAQVDAYGNPVDYGQYAQPQQHAHYPDQQGQAYQVPPGQFPQVQDQHAQDQHVQAPEQPLSDASPLPGPHETDGRDSGAFDYGAVREALDAQESAQESRTPDAHGAAQPAAPASGQRTGGRRARKDANGKRAAASTQKTPRRPLHLGPPEPEQSGAVRPLSARGPGNPAPGPGQKSAPVPGAVPAAPQRPPTQAEAAQPAENPHTASVQQQNGAVPQGGPSSQQVPATGGPEYYDFTPQGMETLPGPQLGALPPQDGQWAQDAGTAGAGPEQQEQSAEYAEGPQLAAYAGDMATTHFYTDGAQAGHGGMSGGDGAGREPVPGQQDGQPQPQQADEQLAAAGPQDAQPAAEPQPEGLQAGPETQVPLPAEQRLPEAGEPQEQPDLQQDVLAAAEGQPAEAGPEHGAQTPDAAGAQVDTPGALPADEAEAGPVDAAVAEAAAVQEAGAGQEVAEAPRGRRRRRARTEQPEAESSGNTWVSAPGSTAVEVIGAQGEDAEGQEAAGPNAPHEEAQGQPAVEGPAVAEPAAEPAVEQGPAGSAAGQAQEVADGPEGGPSTVPAEAAGVPAEAEGAAGQETADAGTAEVPEGGGATDGEPAAEPVAGIPAQQQAEHDTQSGDENPVAESEADGSEAAGMVPRQGQHAEPAAGAVGGPEEESGPQADAAVPGQAGPAEEAAGPAEAAEASGGEGAPAREEADADTGEAAGTDPADDEAAGAEPEAAAAESAPEGDQETGEQTADAAARTTSDETPAVQPEEPVDAAAESADASAEAGSGEAAASPHGDASPEDAATGTVEPDQPDQPGQPEQAEEPVAASAGDGAAGDPDAGVSAEDATSEDPAGAEATEPPAAEVPAGPPAAGFADAEREAVHRLMRERRDIRNGFRSDPIPDEVLLRVLEAAHTAPSVGHSQPWDFVVIRSEETRRTMHELAQRQREAYAKSLPKGRAKQFKELKIEAILDTPVNIVVTADPTRGGRHTLGRHTQPQMAPYSSALAVENLWLAARAEGLGVGWVSFFDERETVRALELPEHLEVVAYLCVGYVDEFPPEPELAQAGWSKRRPLSWVVHEESYGRRVLPGSEPQDLLSDTVAAIRPLDAKALGEAWERQKRMTKPSGALGMLEIISAQLCGLSRKCPPPLPEPAAVAVFAGDHGVHAQGVTPWPQEVTAQMVANFLGGGAVCNAFANQVGAEVCVVDVGVVAELPATPGLLPRKVRAGTADMTQGPALTREEALRAVEVGIETARDLVAAGNKVLLTGEMGIANTTVSAALVSVCAGVDPAEVTGRGTGINDETHARKVDVVRRALELHQPDPADPLGVLAAVGGLEHAALVGLILGAASLRTPVILDGVSAGAAALVARCIAPESLAACIAGHRSSEPGHVAALTKLGLRPLIDLDLRLGEGTGALLSLPLVQSAARAMHEVATFDSAGVTGKS